MRPLTTPDVVPDLGTVLAVFAHPDDETYLAGGLLAALADRGNRVTVVTATDGEHGTDDPVRWPPGRLRATRQWELTGALAVLGIEDHRSLGLSDGGLDRLALDVGASLIAEVVLELQPDTMITFGPDGVTGHPDHRAVASWAVRALERFEGAPRLLQAALEEGYCERFAALHDRLGVFVDTGTPVPVPSTQLALHLELQGPWLDRKVAALRCQATQTAATEAAMGEATFRAWVAIESFVER